jgi:putative sigma-54 modulation protein
MNVEIKGIHLEVNQKTQEYIQAKLIRLDFAKDLIVDFLLSLTKEKGRFAVETTINFRWGASIHVGFTAYDLLQGIDGLFDKLEPKIEKEKSKIKDHHHKKEPVKEAE